MLLTAAAVQGDAAPEMHDPLFDDEIETVPPFPDPFEAKNRGIFGFNREVDEWALEPVAEGYRWLVPGAVREAARQFLGNLRHPTTFANDVLQREWRDAGVIAVHFGINSVLGIAGLFDPATALGFPEHSSDFGQTLALHGVSSGPYLIIPVLGPTTVRDAFGNVIDLVFRPTVYFFGPADSLYFELMREGGQGIAVRAEQDEGLDALEESSIDFYASLRSAYSQARRSQIWRRREHWREEKERAPETPRPGCIGVEHVLPKRRAPGSQRAPMKRCPM